MLLLRGACAALLIAFAAQAAAQNFPTKPIRLIVPIAAGGGPDTIGRAVAQKLTESFGQTMVVDNRAGASGAIAVELAKQAAPDGYTILLISASQVIRPLLFKVPYDLFADFAPITQLSSQSYVLMASQKVPVKSVSELVAYARANPGKLNYASVGQGSQIHLMTELFRSLTKIQAVHVPYKGIGPAYPDLISGNIQFMFGSIITSQGHIRAQRLQALAVSGPKRIKALPELPTVSEAGVRGFAVTQWYALLAPAGTPRATVDFLNKETNQALHHPDVSGRIAAEGSEAVGVTPQQLAAHMKAERDKWAKVIREAGIKGEE
ncbi:MAG TPA: tripartite tricarboxylate transporter substrate binding protein [Burkholderiales bacterium]|nr:tripartite tricarboxylate transporter substrate binding protein [Burkholderiales bacterium]